MRALPAMPRKLIEVALPLEAINAASAREKSIRHGHPSTLHLWWARRPLAAARAVLFAQLVDDPSTWPELADDPARQNSERQRLFHILENIVEWEDSRNETRLRAARKEIARSHARFHRDAAGAARVLAEDATPEEIDTYLATQLPPVHDPFAGGGTIPLEAQRLGLRAIASDLNPVAVLINKALIEIPPKFAGKPPVNPESKRGAAMRTWKGAEGLAEDVRYYGKWMRDEAFKRIGKLYPTAKLPKELGGGEATVIAWLWARTVPCPNPRCGATMPLARSFVLSTKKGKEHRVEPVVDAKTRTVRFEVRAGVDAEKSKGTVDRRGARCVVCGEGVPLEHVRAEGRAGRMGAQMMAIVAEGKRGRIYLPPDPEHEKIAASAKPEWVPDAKLPEEALGFRVQNYGMTTWGSLFTKRQLVALNTFGAMLNSATALMAECGPQPTESYIDAVQTYLSFALNKSVDGSTTLCRWMTQRDSLFNTFAKQALPMTWDFAEVNVLADCTRSFTESIAWTAESVEGSPAPNALVANVQHSDATTLDSSPRIFSTDPPYYDNVPYADLSDFFYVWLRRFLGGRYPELFSTLLVPKQQELVADPFRHGGASKAKAFFESGLNKTFCIMRDAQADDSLTTVFYAFKQSEGDVDDDEQANSQEAVASTGWETILSGLVEAGWSITGTWPMSTERTGRSRDIGSNALASSIVLVCRKRAETATTATRGEFLRALKRTLPRDLKLLQQGNIAPVDFAQAAIGPGMAVFSSYAGVLEPDGKPMAVRTALQLINQVLDEVLSAQEGDFDADTRWSLAWFEQNAFNEAEYGLAETLSKAKNTSVAGLVEAGVLVAQRGRVRLRTREELDAGWDPGQDARRTIWEVTQHLIRVLEAKGEAAASELLAKVGAEGETARELAYRLYAICERKKWAKEAQAYNGLVTAWPELAKLASERAPATDGPAQKALPGM